jgi:hypothetical protein
MLKLMLPLVLLCAGCSHTVITPPADCLAFIPDSWREPVSGAPLPDGMDARAWMAFGVEQTGQLDKANGRQADTLHIIGQCERNANKARPQHLAPGVF